jgi:hypothetical protein
MAQHAVALSTTIDFVNGLLDLKQIYQLDNKWARYLA